MVLARSTRVDLGILGRAWINDLIGQGGEGHVYEVRREAGGPPLALKWYRSHTATSEQLQTIRTLIDFGSPHSRFLWPLSIARISGAPGFGYVMALRDPAYLELSHLLSNTDAHGEPLEVSFAATIELCRQLSYSFLRLHARGLCYRDIAFGNVFFEPASGNVLICDNDNVGIDNGGGRVLGTPFFMAPEVVRDLSFTTLPNTDTDRHSLAVLLFYTLFMGHPLEGRRTQDGLRDVTWLLRHFGTDPVFCMDPERDDNRPPEIVSQYWRIYPTFLRDLFVTAFTVGLHDPGQRVTEGQWIKAMDQLRDALLVCPDCRVTGFWDPVDPTRACRRCAAPLLPDLVLHIGRRRIAVSAGKTLRTDHVRRGVDEPTVIGTVLAHPRTRGRWALHNESESTWTAVYADGVERPTGPGGTVELVHGLRLDVGPTVLTVRRQQERGSADR